jgi:dipeptidyl aminopeptidase/acylaminoacyl peptidase
LVLSPDGAKLAFRVRQPRGPDAVWWVAFDRPQHARRISEARSVADISWSADSRRLVVVAWTKPSDPRPCAVRTIDPRHPDRAKTVYRSATTLRNARLSYALRWLAVSLVDSGTHAEPVAAPSFDVAIIDLERGTEAARWNLSRGDAGSTPAWAGREPRLFFPVWEGPAQTGIGTISLETPGSRTVISTKRRAHRVYVGAAQGRLYYCHDAVAAPDDPSAEGLSVIDLRTGAEVLLIRALRYKQVAVAPRGIRLAYIGLDRSLHVVNAASGRDRVIADGADVLVHGSPWTAADRIVFQSGRQVRSAMPDGSGSQLAIDLDLLARRVGAAAGTGREQPGPKRGH